MSIAVLKRKTNTLKHTFPKQNKVSSKQNQVYNKSLCNTPYITKGDIFSINGSHRYIPPVKKTYMNSKHGTKFITVYDNNNRYVVPVGNGGTYGSYKRVISSNLSKTCNDTTFSSKPSVLSSKYVMHKLNTQNNKYRTSSNKWIISNDNKDYNNGYYKQLKDKEVKLVTYNDKLEKDKLLHGLQFGNSSFHNKRWFSTFSRGYDNAYLTTYKDKQVQLSKNNECKQNCN